MRTTCARCRLPMLAPKPGEICPACLHAANDRLIARRKQNAVRVTTPRDSSDRQVYP